MCRWITKFLGKIIKARRNIFWVIFLFSFKKNRCGWLYGTAAEFLSVQDYKHVQRWAETVYSRPAVKHGRMVNRMQGELSEQLRERHDASDFDTKTQDKIQAAS